MKQITLNAIEVRQDGMSLLITKMKAGDLADFTVIHRYDANKKPDDPTQGYQRPAEMPRVKKFANYLRTEKESGRKVRIPTSLILSGRDAGIMLSPQGTITLSESKKLPLIDGQHRKEGFLHAISAKNMSEYSDYEVPITIMLDLDTVGEMRQFQIVNGTQKSVRTDLVNMILTQLVESEGEDSIREGDHWRVVVSRVVTALNDDKNGAWYDQIVMPDQKMYPVEVLETNPLLRHRRVIRATSFMTSLKQIDSYLHEHEFADDDSLNARSRKLRDVVDAYWQAIRELMPVCFKESDNYVLQKTPGIFALHTLCLKVMKEMHMGHRPWVKEQFKEVLANCEEIKDPSYWYIAQDGNEESGAATRYGSMKGFSELAGLLHTSLRDSQD
jgi:DGQHR domain-containing protein